MTTSSRNRSQKQLSLPTKEAAIAKAGKDSHQTEVGHAPGNEPDFVRRLVAYVCRELPALTDEKAAAIEQAIRGEFGGTEVYVRHTAADIRVRRARQVLKLFNGRNATEVARELGVGRATVYRTLKQSGDGV